MAQTPAQVDAALLQLVTSTMGADDAGDFAAKILPLPAAERRRLLERLQFVHGRMNRTVGRYLARCRARQERPSEDPLAVTEETLAAYDAQFWTEDEQSTARMQIASLMRAASAALVQSDNTESAAAAANSAHYAGLQVVWQTLGTTRADEAAAPPRSAYSHVYPLDVAEFMRVLESVPTEALQGTAKKLMAAAEIQAGTIAVNQQAAEAQQRRVRERMAHPRRAGPDADAVEQQRLAQDKRRVAAVPQRAQGGGQWQPHG
jgi:hypothetical protein